ncbi:IclR family transcriptional regulator [Phytoactinopolyspora limicola]|uniref:IclR family transcriptional regulator n=1 Tax=Phytoactinopolyspora limicola TaxID=2715536 RepID=UPI001A9C5D9E|nr:IclR family transcriptional regulator [Phytoactinopolyspora limicola]
MDPEANDQSSKATPMHQNSSPDPSHHSAASHDAPSDDNTPDDDVISGRDYTQRSVVRVCSILNMLQREVDGVTLNQIVEATGLAKPSAFRYMWTLERQRYVERDTKGGVYRLGLGFAGLQSRRLEVLRERARPWLVNMSKELGETSNLGILDYDAVLYLDVVPSPNSVRLSADAGQRDPINTTALGKAIASTLPESRVRELLASTGLPGVTQNSITSTDHFLEELDRTRKAGYAIDDGENDPDGRCVAAPLLGTRIAAAISISAPAFRQPKRQLAAIGRRLVEIANEITPHPDEVFSDAIADAE